MKRGSADVYLDTPAETDWNALVSTDRREWYFRLTAEGGLRTCLFSLHETPLRDLMRSGVSDDHLGGVIESAIWRKEEGHLINQPGFIKPAKSMSQIGG